MRVATLVGQDWGGLIGLRMAAGNPDRFDRIVAANTGLPLAREMSEDRLRAVKTFPSPATPTPTMQEMAAALSSIDPEAHERKFAYWQKWHREPLGATPPAAQFVTDGVARHQPDACRRPCDHANVKCTTPRE